MNRAFATSAAGGFTSYCRRNYFNSLQPQHNIISRFRFTTTTTKRRGLVYCSSNNTNANRHLMPPVDHCHHRQHRYIRSINSKDDIELEERKMIQHKQPKRSNKTDPTAKRPTKKCDPYGLNGQSLSFDECFNLLSTLDDGWRILDSSLTTIETVEDGDTTVLPKVLQRQCYHNSFHEASKFLSYIAYISTNINHYPILTMERILVDDLNNIVQTNNTTNCINNLSNDDNVQVSKKNSSSSSRKVKGWMFQSTISCSTYRPSSSLSSNQRQSKEERESISSDIHGDKGLTYHDFHLAMSIDVELNKNEIKSLIY